MHRSAVIIATSLAMVGLSGACKGKTKYKDTEETTKKLSDCETKRDEQKAYIDTLEKQLADLSGQGGVVVVNIEGEPFKVAGKGPHERTGSPGGSASDTKLYEAFVAALKRSQGSIQKCYENALKNNDKLQARSVTVSIDVAYKTSGEVSRSTFTPRIDESFARCMDAVAHRWTLPGMPSAVSFNYKQTLTPDQ